MKLLSFIPLLQDDYGKPMDCTLVSVVACVLYKLHNPEVYAKVIYVTVERIAKSLGYDGESGGLWVNSIKPLYEQTLQHFGLKGTATRRYIKGIGYTFNTIKNQIDMGNPVILSVEDVRGTKYKRHTVVVVGYDNDSLIIYDNWDLNAHKIKYSAIDIGAVITYTK